MRSDAPRGQSLVEALQGLGATELGGRSFDIAAIELGERIRNGRLRVGMTQAELAARVGCKQADISKIENGKGRDGPTYRRLRSFSDVLGVELGIGDRTVGGDVEVVTKTKDCVVHAKAPYSQYAPLLSRGQWASLREYAFKRAPAADADGAWDFCTLVSLEPTTRATLRLHDVKGALILALIRGTGTVQVHNGHHRQRRLGPVCAGAAVGVLKAGTAVEVASDDESLSVMMVPAAVLLDQTAAAEECA